MEYATRHSYFPYTHKPLGECVYEENTSDKWHVPQYPTRKHCITTLSHALIFGKLMKILGRARKSLFEELKRFMKLLENFRNSSKVFSRCFYDFFKVS